MPDLGASTEMLLAFGALLVLRVPVAFALGLAALFAMWRMGFGLDLAGDLLTSGITKFSLLAIPFFILAGMLMGRAGLAERMIRFFRVLVGGLPGGMGLVGVVVSLFWGAVSGSGPASVAAIGPMLVRGMAEDGYPRAFAAALVCTGAALSIVIPPSIGLIVYGVIAQVSIAKLFIASILPGVLMGVLMLAVLPVAGRGRTGTDGGGALAELAPMPYADRPWGVRLRLTFREAFWGLLTPLVILGGIYAGVFTPTEAAIVAVVYALLVGLLIYRTLSLAGLVEVLGDAAASSAAVMLIVTFASLFGWVVTVDGMVGRYSEGLLALSDSPAVVLAILGIILLVAGMFMDAVTIMFIALPIFLPVVHDFGWDPVWFGVFLMIALAIGLFTPPVGINLFVAAQITRLSFERIALAALPFLVVGTVGLVVVAAWPGLTAYLLAWMAE